MEAFCIIVLNVAGILCNYRSFNMTLKFYIARLQESVNISRDKFFCLKRNLGRLGFFSNNVCVCYLFLSVHWTISTKS